ncbi:hypothetical protein AKO1_003841 [Acrasis kona]|uniref:Uncharacterized protein n=1 Tax=Acrasis kona TaxID=1008807 RepID=A0AAW2ZHJ9_9EUKA
MLSLFFECVCSFLLVLLLCDGSTYGSYDTSDNSSYYGHNGSDGSTSGSSLQYFVGVSWSLSKCSSWHNSTSYWVVFVVYMWVNDGDWHCWCVDVAVASVCYWGIGKWCSCHGVASYDVLMMGCWDHSCVFCCYFESSCCNL